MRTRDLMGWHFDVRDLLDVAALALAGAALQAAQLAADALERRIEERAHRRDAILRGSCPLERNDHQVILRGSSPVERVRHIARAENDQAALCGAGGDMGTYLVAAATCRLCRVVALPLDHRYAHLDYDWTPARDGGGC